MDNDFDSLAFNLLNDQAKCRKFLDAHSEYKGKRSKTYQTFVDETRNIGYIIERQVNILGVYNDENQCLGRLIGESDIHPIPLGGVIVESYHSFDISILGITDSNPHRSLGKLFLFSQGIILLPGQEAHHKLHAMLNDSSIVLAVSKKENASKYQELSTTQALEYIKTDMLRFDDATYERYLNNISLLCNCYKAHRGVYVNGIDLASICLNDSMIKDIKVELSHF